MTPIGELAIRSVPEKRTAFGRLVTEHVGEKVNA
jgi:hypothetical protein